jgi:hypothetical protein
MFYRWLSVYTNTVTTEINESTAPRLLIDAMNSMYMSATRHETDLGKSLLELIEKDPAILAFANCGSSSDFLLLAMRAFDVPARRVSLWHTITDGHEAIEYFSVEHGKFVFYDPLYATHLVDSVGIPAGISDIQAEIAKHGFTPSLWKYQPKLTRSPGQLVDSATDPKYDYYRQRGYSVICRFYFTFVAVRYEDYSPLRQFLPGSVIVRGRWTLYDHSAKADLPTEEKLARQISIMRRFSADNGGRYYIDARSLQP